MPWVTPPVGVPTETYLSGNTLGTSHIPGRIVTFLASDNVTLSGGGNQIVFVAAGGTAPSGGGAALSAGTQSVGTGTVVFSNSNGISFGMSGSTRITASYTVPAVPAQSAFVLSDANGLAWGTAGSTVTGSYTVPNVPAQTAFVLSDSNGISWGTNGSTVTATVKTDYLTVQTAQPALNALSAGTQSVSGVTVKLSDSNGISFGLGSGANSTLLTASYTVPSVPAQTQFVLSNSNGVSFGTNGSTVTATVATNYLTTGRASTDAVGLNTAQTNVTWTVNSSGFSLNAGGYAGTVSGATGASLTVNSSGVSVNVPAGPPGFSWFEIIPGEVLQSAYAVTATNFSNRPVLVPFKFEGSALQAKTVRFLASGIGSSNTLSLVATIGAGFYSVSNSTQIGLVSSTTNGFSLTDSSRWNGVFLYDITGLSNFNLTQGQWVLGLYVSATATANMNLRVYGASNMPALVGYQSASGSGATNATSNIVPFWGAYTATTAGFPAAIQASQVSGGNSQFVADVYVMVKAV